MTRYAMMSSCQTQIQSLFDFDAETIGKIDEWAENES